MIYYTSDPHFFHENMIRLCDRPFQGVEEMNQVIIERWNNVVKSNDSIYILGDFAMRYPDTQSVYRLIEQLNGRKYLITGNHDKLRKDIKFCNYFEYVKNYDEIVDKNRRVILFHYPMEDWNGRWRGSYHLYGHIHNSKQCVHGHVENRFNVCMDVNDFTPVTLDQLIRQEKRGVLDV